MIIDKKTKQKYQKQKRSNLPMYFHLLQSPPQLFLKIYPNIININLLQIITTIHLNYLISTFITTLHVPLYLSKKANQINQYANKSINYVGIQNIKIGIIGGGVMGRLFLNSLIVMQKQGLDPSNITLSTRQYEDLDYYKTQFKINVEFNNEKLAEQSDILLITAPSTLDNWIIADLKKPLSKRVTRCNPPAQSLSSAYQPLINTASKFKKTPFINSNYATRALSNTYTTNPKNTLNPLVYITTSNMTSDKLSKLFNFPIFIPIIRGEQTHQLKQFVQIIKGVNGKNTFQQLQLIQKTMTKYIAQSKNQIKQVLNFAFENYIPQQQRSLITPILLPQKHKRSNKISTQKLDRLQKNQSIPSSSLNGTSYGQFYNSLPQVPQIVQNLIEQILIQNQTIENTFVVKCKKWKNNYDNYVA